MKVIISGGGTGGHVFPAIAIADAIRRQQPDAEILFVGAKGKLEMEKVPAAGYQIKGLDIAGMQRKLTLKNLTLPFKVMTALWQARKIVYEFKPDVAVGVGGYASGPLLKVCGWMGIPYVIQEQNSYAGVTNKLLAKKAAKVFVAYHGMDRFFDAKKIIMTGNPVRAQIAGADMTTEEARAGIGVDTNKKTTLVFGGSLGARTLNEAIAGNESWIKANQDVQFIWQVGKLYYDDFSKTPVAELPNVKVLPFIEDMATAYKAADVVVCRAGALTISELALVGKPAILVPSPNVAEDHQTHNAMALVNEGAALMVRDDEAKTSLMGLLGLLMKDQEKQQSLSNRLLALARPGAAAAIASGIIETAGNA
ncbi:MAG: undecaprenyldiphospho-muramoylpentapeptide beta-N-acetylglucosaminyltransferase [Saprospiraceae bacterium]|nr:undecaprenyldiphospho-muramoylpentapeptide beta-N-acetylglucosaminyltransferase [Saprospiraceae bacterium]